MVEIREIESKSLLSRSRIHGVDYSVNPYLGCEHGCVYCYARFMLNCARSGADWGEFAYPKTNAPEVLAREPPRAKRGLVSLSRLPTLSAHRGEIRADEKGADRAAGVYFPVSILTKSSLVRRDIDLLQQFDECEVGLTVTTLDERVRRVLEPRSVPVNERLVTLDTLRKSGIRTYGFVGPLLPFLTGETLEPLIDKLTIVGVEYIFVDRLNIKYGNWRTIREALIQHYPQLLPKYERVLFSTSDYFNGLKLKISELCEKSGLKHRFCY